MKTGKSSGADKINTEVLKALDRMSTKLLVSSCNQVYEVATIPGDTNVKKVKGHHMQMLRALSLMSHIFKLILRVLLKRKNNELREKKAI